MEKIGSNPAFWSGSIDAVAELYKRRDLFFLLVKRDTKSKYKGSGLGILWSLIRPLSQLLIYYFIIGKVLGVANAVPDFAIYVFVGLTAWGLFSEIVNSGPSSLVANAGIIKKIYLPREIFPLSVATTAIFNFFIQLSLLMVASFVLEAPPVLTNIGTAILAFSVIVTFGLSISLIVSAINVYIRDTQHLVEVFTGLLMWASPIIYSYTFVSKGLQENWLLNLYLANPVTIAILGFQKCFWAAGSELPNYWPPDLDLRLQISLAISFFVLFLAHRLFTRLQTSFAQEL